MVDVTGNVNPTFHVVFRENDGTPLIGGSVYWYKASDHSTLKNVYEDRDRNISLPNPTPLNNAGIVSDNTGAPKPVYLEDDENYYVVTYRAGESPPTDIPVQTVDDWNADNAFSTQPKVDEIVTTNFIPNAQFRSLVNAKTEYTADDLNASNNILIARNNWYLRRDVLTSTNIIEFKEFIAGQTDVPFNPKYYLNFACSVISTETKKDFTVDIGDVQTFSNQEMTFAIYAKSSTISQIEILVDQDFGSGGSSQVLTVVDSFQLTNTWTQYNTTFTVADVGGKTIGANNKFRIRIRVPLNQICNIAFVMSQLNFGNTVLEFDYQPSIDNDGNASKDAIPQPTSIDAFKTLTVDSDNITNVWRSFPAIGNVEWHASPIVPTGYLECNWDTYSGIIGSIYRNLAVVISNRWGVGADGFAAQNEATKYLSVYLNKFDTNVTDITDGTTGFTFETTADGGDKGFTTADHAISTARVTNKSNGNVTDATAGTSGFTVNVVQQGTGALPEITDITTLGSTGLDGKYFLISSTTTDYYVWFTVDGVGTDPAVASRTGIKVALPSGAGTAIVKEAIYYALNGCELAQIVCDAASTITGGDYFLLYNSTTTFVCWYKVGGAGTEPTVAGTKVEISVGSGLTDVQVASTTRNILETILFRTPDLRGYIVRGYDHGAGVDPDSASRLGKNPSTIGDNVGTYQEDENKAHTHTTPQGLFGAGVEAFGAGSIGLSTTSGSSGGNESRPKNVYLMPIIKY